MSGGAWFLPSTVSFWCIKKRQIPWILWTNWLRFANVWWLEKSHKHIPLKLVGLSWWWITSPTKTNESRFRTYLRLYISGWWLFGSYYSIQQYDMKYSEIRNHFPHFQVSNKITSNKSLKRQLVYLIISHIWVRYITTDCSPSLPYPNKCCKRYLGPKNILVGSD